MNWKSNLNNIKNADIKAMVNSLSTTLDAFPAAFKGNKLNLLFLEEAHPIRCARSYLMALDGLQLGEERREYFLGDWDEWPFPAFRIEQKPNPWKVSEVLFERFEKAREVLIRQQDIGQILYERAVMIQADIVALIIVDGLSFYDLLESAEAEPCLVDGVTITQFGYREIIGKPTISQHLFSGNYRAQIGITYFDKKSNVLTNDLYATFGNSQVHRIQTFDEGLEKIQKQKIRRGYIQITAPGLDGICHFHRDKPHREEYLNHIFERFQKLITFLKQGGQKILVCLTADHGILWRDQLYEKLEVVDDLLHEDKRHPRYVTGSLRRSYTRIEKCRGQSYSLLKLPYLTRPLKRTEWGVHGGISAWESIVPLIIHES